MEGKKYGKEGDERRFLPVRTVRTVEEDDKATDGREQEAAYFLVAIPISRFGGSGHLLYPLMPRLNNHS
jgi:hypothetical protein